MLQRLGAMDRHRGHGRGKLTTPKASKKCREIILRAHLKFTLETKVSLQQNTQSASIGQKGEREEGGERKEGGGKREEEGGEGDALSPLYSPKGHLQGECALDLSGSCPANRIQRDA